MFFKKVIFLIIFVFLLSGCTNNKIENTTQTPVDKSVSPSPTNIKASFLVFTNGTKRIFTDSKYHNLNTYLYLDSQQPTTIISKENATWGEFFKTLPMELTTNCLTTGTKQEFCTNSVSSLKFYINGLRDNEALDRTINNGDELLVSYGPEKDNEDEIMQQIEQVPSPN